MRRIRVRRLALAATPLALSLLAACAGSTRPSDEPADSGAPRPGAAAPGVADPVTGERYIVVVRRQATDRGALSAEALSARVGVAVRAAGGTIVGHLVHLDAVIATGVRDVAALRRHETVASVVPAAEHSPPPPPAGPPTRPPG